MTSGGGSDQPLPIGPSILPQQGLAISPGLTMPEENGQQDAKSMLTATVTNNRDVLEMQGGALRFQHPQFSFLEDVF